MNQVQYNQWVQVLAQLNVAQLNDLSTRIKLLADTAKKQHAGKQDFGDRVVKTICDVMNKHRVETPSVAVLRRSTAYVSNRYKFDDLATFFEKVSNQKIVQDALLRVAIEQLYYDLIAWQGIAVSSHMVLKQIHRLPSVLNKSFPGYASEGLLIKLVK